MCVCRFSGKSDVRRAGEVSCDRRTDLDAVPFPARAAETCIYDLRVEGIPVPLVTVLLSKLQSPVDVGAERTAIELLFVVYVSVSRRMIYFIPKTV
jgi:hypothetical protein